MASRPRSFSSKSPKSASRHVLITGANRGIGRAVALIMRERGYSLILTSRDRRKLKKTEWPDAVLMSLDVSRPSSIRKLVADLRKRNLPVDILINNAGISPKQIKTVFDVSYSDLITAFRTNTAGPFLLAGAFLPQMVARGFGRIVNVSSQMGAFQSLERHSAAYRVSKTALNAVTKILADAAAQSGSDVLVNAVCPGWVRSEMGGPLAPRSLEKGADSVAWAATLPQGGPNGGFFLDGVQVSW